MSAPGHHRGEIQGAPRDGSALPSPGRAPAEHRNLQRDGALAAGAPAPRAPGVATAHPSDRRAANVAWRRLVADASRRYRAGGHFAWFFARGKLALDPVFRHLLQEGLVPPGARVLDIGCGQGLLASLLAAVGDTARLGAWPAGWAAAPADCRVTGIEMMERDVERARRALGDLADVSCGDMRELPFAPADVVVILDVLHYVDHAAQDAVLARVHQALAPGGVLLLRVGDAAAARRFPVGGFRFSQWSDRLVTRVRGHRAPPTWCRPLGEWTARLASLGYAVEARPMSRGTPFANVLLVARRARGGA